MFCVLKVIRFFKASLCPEQNCYGWQSLFESLSNSFKSFTLLSNLLLYLAKEETRRGFGLVINHSPLDLVNISTGLAKLCLHPHHPTQWPITIPTTSIPLLFKQVARSKPRPWMNLRQSIALTLRLMVAKDAVAPPSPRDPASTASANRQLSRAFFSVLTQPWSACIQT